MDCPHCGNKVFLTQECVNDDCGATFDAHDHDAGESPLSIEDIHALRAKLDALVEAARRQLAFGTAYSKQALEEAIKKARGE